MKCAGPRDTAQRPSSNQGPARTPQAAHASKRDRAYEAMDVNQLMVVFLETPDEGMKRPREEPQSKETKGQS